MSIASGVLKQFSVTVLLPGRQLASRWLSEFPNIDVQPAIAAVNFSFVAAHEDFKFEQYKAIIRSNSSLLKQEFIIDEVYRVEIGNGS